MCEKEAKIIYEQKEVNVLASKYIDTQYLSKGKSYQYNYMELSSEVSKGSLTSKINKYDIKYDIKRKVFQDLGNDNDLLFLMSRLKRKYTVANFSKLLKFLSNNQSLFELLFEAHGEIKKYFPLEEIVLEVVLDPEIDSHEGIFAYILTSLPVAEALRKLDEFDEEWFLNQLDRTNGLFNFNLRFV